MQVLEDFLELMSRSSNPGASRDELMSLNLFFVETITFGAAGVASGIPGPHQSGKTAVVGHTASEEGEVLDADYLICLDTWCYGGGWLTAMDLRTRQTWQANQQGQSR